MASGLDLGIAGRTALVCGSSSGLGRACAIALGRAGVELVLNGRTPDRLEKTAQEIIQITAARVRHVVADVTTAEGRAKLLAECPDPDILINNAAGPPPGDFREFDEAAWHDALRTSMVAPIMLIRSVVDGMIARRWGRILNITSTAVKSPLPLLGLSNGARSGLTGFVAGLAREVAEHGVTINNLLPGRFATDRLNAYIAKVAESQGTDEDATSRALLNQNPMKRFGRPEEFGAWCAFLASEHAAFVTGQNLVLDGGEYRGW